MHRTATRALALTAAVLLAGCTDPDAAGLVGSARKSMAAQDTAAAKQHLRAALQLAPGDAQAHFLLGSLLHQEGNMAAAETELGLARDGGHAAEQVLPLLAESRLANGKAEAVVQQFGTTVLADAAAQTRMNTTLAEALLTTGRLAEARQRVDQLLAQQPDNFRAQVLRARLTAQGGDPDGALKLVDDLLRRQPDSTDVWMLRGDLLARAAGAVPPRAAAADAVGAYREALRRRPDAVEVHAALVALHLERHDLTAAIVQWNDMLKAAPRHRRTWLLEVAISNARGDFTRAREVAQRLLRDTPDDAQVRLLAGEAGFRLRDLVQARVDLVRAMHLAPQAPRPRLLLAQVLLDAGQAEQALATLEPLSDRAEPDFEALLLKARALQQGGAGAAADATLARAVARNPQDPRARSALALSSLARGRNVAQATAELRALAAADSGTLTDLALIEALMQAQDLPGAGKAIDTLAAKAPNDTSADLLRARIALATRDPDAARRHYAAALVKDADSMQALSGLAELDLTDRKSAAAQARYEAVLGRNDRHVPALLALADLNTRAGGAPAATQAYLQRAVAADPGDAAPRVLLADHLLVAGQARGALDAAQAGLAMEPDHADLLERQGRAQLALGNPQQAVATYTRLAAAAPRSAGAQLRLAEALAATGQGPLASAAIQRAGELAPHLAAVRKAMAEDALRENRPDQALAIARRLQAERPGEGTGWSIEADVEWRQGHWNAAAAALRQVVARPEPGDAAVRLYVALQVARKAAEADAFGREWRAKHPEDVGFLLQLADQSLATGQPDEAAELYRDALRQQPDNGVALGGMARILAQRKQAGAVAMAEQALARAPRSAVALDTLAYALASEGRLARAVEVQRQAVAAAPESHAHRLRLAQLLIDHDDKSAARVELLVLAQLGKRFERHAEVDELLARAR